MGSHQNSFANCSKAQNCLLKILKIISTVPPPHSNTPPSQNLNGFAIDLNIGFNLPAEESGSPVDGGYGNTADEKSSVVAECGGVDFEKCSDDDGEEKSYESDVVQLQSTENQEEIGELKQQQGFMDLLIQAATLIFGDFNSKSEECETDTKTFKLDNNNNNGDKLNTDEQHHEEAAATKKHLKRRTSEYTEEVIEDKSSYPLIRSKRGRIQVLPNKYRDSILEPLTPLSRIRSTIIPNRRRSK